MTQDPLPGMPHPPPRRDRPPAAGVKLVRSTTPHLCQVCCELIHKRGIEKAPYPRPARWRRITPAAHLYLCEGHKENQDDEMDT